MGFVDRLRACADFDPAAYLPFSVDGADIGWVRPELAARLAGFADVFEVSADGVRLAPGLVGCEARSRAVAGVLRRLAADGVVQGWRDEPYKVASQPEGETIFLMERAAIPRFGIWGSGVHVNGYVRDGGKLSMWIGRRSPDKQTAPNKLDQIVAGGRDALHSVRETLLKEAEEEAGIAAELAARAVPVGTITYCTERADGLRRDVLYLYDLELPSEFVPVNHDGEIAKFELWPIARVLEQVRDTDDFKFNCALVVVDFLIRHGVVTPDEEPSYLTLVQGLHAGI